MARIAGVVLALALSVTTFAGAQAPVAAPQPSGAPVKSGPSGNAEPSAFTIDQKGVKRSGSATAAAGKDKGEGDVKRIPAHTPEWTPGPAKAGAATAAPAQPAAQRKAGPLPGNGKDTPEEVAKAKHDTAKNSINNVR